MKNKGFKILMIVFLILVSIDFYTAYMNKDMLQYIEVNPLYLLTGSLIPVILLNIGVALFCWFLYKNKYAIPFVRFNLLNFFIWVSFARILAIRSNILAYLYPPTLAVAQSITTEYKIVVATSHTLLYFILPFVVCMLTYLFFRLDHNIERLDDDNKKKKKKKIVSPSLPISSEHRYKTN